MHPSKFSFPPGEFGHRTAGDRGGDSQRRNLPVCKLRPCVFPRTPLPADPLPPSHAQYFGIPICSGTPEHDLRFFVLNQPTARIPEKPVAAGESERVSVDLFFHGIPHIPSGSFVTRALRQEVSSGSVPNNRHSPLAMKPAAAPSTTAFISRFHQGSIFFSRSAFSRPASFRSSAHPPRAITWQTAPAASYRKGLAMRHLYQPKKSPSMSVIWDCPVARLAGANRQQDPTATCKIGCKMAVASASHRLVWQDWNKHFRISVTLE